jgi:outer membrane protein assembly factor BamE (lipoprotein component of BamABCDE complex)
MLRANEQTLVLRTSRPWLTGVILFVALGMSVACTPIYRTHGYIPQDTELALLEVGRDTRDTVAITVGAPSAPSLLNDEAWFYVQSRWKNFGAFVPKEEIREVLAISFDDAGVISNIERFGLERGQIVTLSRRVTTSNVKGQSVLNQLFGNVGKIDTGDLLK